MLLEEMAAAVVVADAVGLCKFSACVLMKMLCFNHHHYPHHYHDYRTHFGSDHVSCKCANRKCQQKKEETEKGARFE